MKQWFLEPCVGCFVVFFSSLFKGLEHKMNIEYLERIKPNNSKYKWRKWGVKGKKTEFFIFDGQKCLFRDKPSYECPVWCLNHFQDVGCFRAHKVSHKVIMKGLSQFRSLKIPLKEFISPFDLQNWKFKVLRSWTLNISNSWLWLKLFCSFE